MDSFTTNFDGKGNASLASCAFPMQTLRETVMYLLFLMLPNTKYEGNGNALLAFMLFETNFKEKGNVFLVFYAPQNKL